jgi:glycosyltransferase involved in cell wall biosynthesis
MDYVLDIRTISPHFPGIGRYVRNLARALPNQLAPGERLILLGSEGQIADLRSAIRQPVGAAVCDASPFDLRQQWQVPRLLRRAALYHSPYYLMPYRTGRPTIMTFYDAIPLRFPDHVSSRARLLFWLALRLAIHSANHVIVISQSACHDLRSAVPSLRPSDVTTIYAAADPRFAPQSAAAIAQVRARYALPADFFLYVGSNKPHKNLPLLVQAHARLPASAPPLVIAGPWDVRYPQAKQIADPARVRFLGPVDDADLPALYGAALAFVFPSRYEGFGLPVLEAMACGTPVICSNAASLPEVAGNAALLVDPTNPSMLAEALQRILDDRALREQLSARGLGQAARFSWAQAAVETLAIYRQVAG